MSEWKPKVGDILSSRDRYQHRHIVIGETYTGNDMHPVKWFEILNVESGETWEHRHDFDWWNWYTQERTCV